jgi:hypothetical protein
MPVSPVLGFTYPTPLDPATADLWGFTLNTIFLEFDARAITYDWGIKSGGVISLPTEDFLIWGAIPNPRRFYRIYASTSIGSITVTLKKNGTAIGGLGSVVVTSTPATTIVDSGGNPYIDFATSDTLSIEIEAVAGAENLFIWMQVLDNNP